MREWMPISTSPKGRLALAAVREFGSHAFEDVTVGALATSAQVTTGAIYHHFESKLGLYEFVRTDVERRVLDRMEGALAAGGGVSAALLVGFDYAAGEGFLHLLGAPPAGVEEDRLAVLLGAAVEPASPVLGRILAAAWRAALSDVSAGGEIAAAREALARISLA